MDPEKQPLLNTGRHNIRQRKFRTLTPDEVLESRHDPTWRRAQFFLVVMFWSLIIMCLSIITCILINTAKCTSVDMDMKNIPSVPPVHLSLAPLMFSGRNFQNQNDQ